MSEEETVTTTETVDVEKTPEAAPEAATTEEAETSTSEEAKTDTEGETVETEDSPKEKPKPDSKVAKAKFEARELRRENKRLAKMLETQIDNVAKAKPEVKAPKIEDFETMDDYLNAQFEFRDAKNAPPEKTASHDENADVREELFSNGLEKYEDFEDVVLGSRSITAPMADALLEIDDPDLQVDVAYFIGQNPKEAARISKLSERRQIAELAKLEVKLSTKAPAKKQVSKAPKPIKPLGGTKTSNDGFIEGESMKDFLKKRYKQLGR